MAIFHCPEVGTLYIAFSGGGASHAAEMRVPALQAASLLTTAMMTAAPHHQLTMSEDMQERLSLLPKGERSRVVFQAAGLQLPFLKARGESKEHLLMKALLWSLMVDTEMNVECELDIGHRYKPDVVALSGDGQPRWWGECGSVSAEKLSVLREAFPSTRITVCKWGHSDLSGYAAQLRQALPAVRVDANGAPIGAPIDLVSFPVDSVERFVANDGALSVTWECVDTMEVECKVARRRGGRGE